MNWLLIATQVIQLLPSILQAIMEIEKAVGPGNGDVKKAIVMSALPDGAPVEKVSAAVDASVKALNVAGKLTKAA